MVAIDAEQLGESSGQEPVEILIKKLEDRSFKTYKHRLFAYGRLHWLNQFTNNLLVAFSTSTTIGSVGMLADRNMYGSGGDALMVALAILSLVASLVVASSSYGTRAKAMETTYKQLQRLSVEAENLRHGFLAEPQRSAEFKRLQREYYNLIESSENHTDGDHARMEKGKQPSLGWAYSLFVVPGALLVPFAVWFVGGL
ncbi:SLATT domain-containing protein [Actinomycetospora lutea]|uniref:SLATT domain-containing protein n=1 Tax=Actinomycetospora lutea TaxID=663604 RepID=UPI002365A29E|nr:SLATT domain-containing protein [Actinomycetospora lutea]MDD7936979.1 SLATT domain-containing protein [Actinomycetospora lutea]